MAKTKISELSEGGVALGENKFKEGMLLDAAIAAGELVMATATGIALNNLTSGDYLGIMKEHEEIDLDTDITAALYGDVITEGYCAARIVDPAGTKYPGTLLFGIVGTPGALSITVPITAVDPTYGSRLGEPIAVLERTIVTGDTVAIVKLLR